MPATFIRTCSLAKAEKTRDAIAAAFPHEQGYGPILMEEGFDDRQWTIVWEEGVPEEWVYSAGDKVAAPAGTFLEAVNPCQLAICLR